MKKGYSLNLIVSFRSLSKPLFLISEEGRGVGEGYPQEHHSFMDPVLSSFALQGPLCFPENAREAWLPGDRRQATACIYASGRAWVSITWRHKDTPRPIRPATHLPRLCLRQDQHRSRPQPRPRSRPWSPRRALSTRCLGPPAARTRCPSPCFMGRWTLKTRSWPPVRRRYRSCWAS